MDFRFLDDAPAHRLNLIRTHVVIQSKMDSMWWFPWKYIAIGGAGVGILLLKRRFGGAKCTAKALMNGKTVIVTGANTGIGKETATELAKRGARVILACRNLEAAESAAKYIRKSTKNEDVVVRELDLASFVSIREFARQIEEDKERVDVLINNAGVYQCPYQKTSDGLEMQMGVNHFGHFLLTNLLLDRLTASAPSRVVVVSSGLHKLGKIVFDNLNSERYYDKRAAYRNSKLANNLFAIELARRVEDKKIGVYTLHPGMARTDLGRHIPLPRILKVILYPLAWLFTKSPWEACQTVVYCAIAQELEGISGKYYGNCKEEPWPTVNMELGTAKRLWEVSEKITQLQ